MTDADMNQRVILDLSQLSVSQEGDKVNKIRLHIGKHGWAH